MGNYLAKYLITALRTFAVLNVAKSCCNLNNSCSFRYRAPYFVYFSAIGNAHRTRSRTNVRTARHILLLNFNLQNRRVLRIPAESEKCLNSAIRDGISPPPPSPKDNFNLVEPGRPIFGTETAEPRATARGHQANRCYVTKFH